MTKTCHVMRGVMVGVPVSLILWGLIILVIRYLWVRR